MQLKRLAAPGSALNMVDKVAKRLNVVGRVMSTRVRKSDSCWCLAAKYGPKKNLKRVKQAFLEQVEASIEF